MHDITTSNSLADLAARIRQVAGVTDSKTGDSRRSIIRNAAKTCSRCGRCGRALTPEEPVWRTCLALGYGFLGRWQTRMAPCCEQCAAKWLRRFQPARPCENCQRPVHQENNFRSHRRTFCCEACERAARATAARHQRSKPPRQCETCGETFEPTRTDSQFCSAACRQRAYRRRKAVTADEHLHGETFTSRNAPADVVVPATAEARS